VCGCGRVKEAVPLPPLQGEGWGGDGGISLSQRIAANVDPIP